jgi:hypothetical protein
MKEQISQGKKNNSSVSIPTLKNPTRGFGLNSPENTTPVNTETVNTDIETVSEPLTYDISRVSFRPQAKLSNSQPSDFPQPPENSFTQQVMRRMAQPGNHTIQRQETSEEDTDVQLKPFLQLRPSIFTKPQTPESDIETSIQQSRGSGQPLPDDIKQPMEQAFGADFGGVRVHTDGKSDNLNKSIQARAFTTGQDIFFRQGEYSPGSSTGKELLAHELTHVVQQNGGSVQRKSVTKIARKENKDNNNNSQKVLETDNQQPAKIFPKTTQNSPISAPQPNNLPAPETPQNQNQQVGTPEKENKPQNNQKQVTSAVEITVNAGNSSSANSGKNNSNTTTNTGEKAPTSPQEDPGFQEVVNNAKEVGTKSKEHEPAATKSKEAQDAAQSPEAEIKGKAQDQQVGEMEAQKPGTFNATAFKEQLLNKIKEITPKTEDEAKEFKNNNKIDQVKDQVSSQVKNEKENAANPIENKVDEQPDTSSVKPKEVNPLAAPQPEQPTTDIASKNAAPKPKTNSEVSAPLQQNSQEIDQKMAEAKITDEQLAKSNEPQFLTTLEAKKQAKTHVATAPQEYRQQEQGIISKAEGEAENLSQTGLQGMHSEKENILTQVIGKQEETKGQDEGKREEIGNHINGIYENTKTEVEKCLSDLDQDVNSKFDNASNTAKSKFENYVGQKMDAYKAERYGEWYDVRGWGNRISDAVTGLPPEVNKFFEDGRELYINEMDTALTEIANLVANKLNEAKQKIVDGKQEIQEYVNSLPENLQQIGKEAADNIQSKFDELAQSVDDKKNELIDSLANKYQENLQAVDARIEEMKEANKGLVDKVKEGIQGVWETIQKLREMFMNTLAKVAGVIDKILSDPIAFLNNLVSGIKQGFNNFTANILTHLQTGLISWLTGALGGMGIQLPEDIFSLPGILSLVMQVLGLNWGYIRGKGVKLFGEPVMVAMEEGSELLPMLMNGDYVGMWEHLKEEFNDLKESVIEQIKEMVITQVITAGVKWIIGLLNPASAFVKAAMAIYDIVMFFINRGSQILDLVNAITDAVAAIANGAIDGAAQLVENALAKSLPVVIGFLASLLGIGDLAKKVQDIIGKIRQRIDKAIDKLLAKVKKLFKGKKGETAQTPGATADTANHQALAEQAASELKENSQGKGYEDLRKEKQAQAKTIEAKYTAQLKNGIKMSVKFSDVAQDKKDNDLDFKVIIAPNDTVFSDQILTDKLDDNEGTESNPILLDWPKPASDNYPKLYFGGKTNKAKTQAELKNKVGKKDETGEEIKEYNPSQQTPLSGGERIGISSKYEIKVGKIVGPLSTSHTPGGGKINDVLKRYGFRPATEGMDGDHVQEIQFGGQDALPNLWPLDRSTNRGAGAILSQATIEGPSSNKKAKISSLKEDTSRKYYFKINSVK